MNNNNNNNNKMNYQKVNEATQQKKKKNEDAKVRKEVKDDVNNDGTSSFINQRDIKYAQAQASRPKLRELNFMYRDYDTEKVFTTIRRIWTNYDLSMLMRLNLSINKIEYIDLNMFLSLDYLANLDLSRNQIGVVEAAPFSQMKHLTKLDLSFNIIETIELNSFKTFQRLLQLDLSSNFIKRIDKKLFDNLIKVFLVILLFFKSIKFFNF
jgi:Leucine-rich repeat (LRR) protein